MQEVYGLNTCMNSEIRFRWVLQQVFNGLSYILKPSTWPALLSYRWLRLCVRAKWEEAVPLALKMATDQGRMKFTRPLFRYLLWFLRTYSELVVLWIYLLWPSVFLYYFQRGVYLWKVPWWSCASVSSSPSSDAPGHCWTRRQSPEGRCQQQLESVKQKEPVWKTVLMQYQVICTSNRL